MLLIDRLSILALVGLFAQALVSWIFVGVFAALYREEARRPELRSWIWAFVALSVALTALSLRYLFGFEFSPYHSSDRSEGTVFARVGNTVYQAGKAIFCLLIYAGACNLAGKQPGRWLRWVFVLCPIVLGAPAWMFARIEPLLTVQAPAMVLFLGLAWWRLGQVRERRTTGLLVVRLALLLSALAWVMHGLISAFCLPRNCGVWNTVGSLNSFFDLALEILLGVGIIIAVLQDMHVRLRGAQKEQARLRSVIDRDERLRALGTLVSGVAHELNNPLTAILGFSEDVADPQAGERAAIVIREQAERCRGIVRSLSALAGEVHRSRESTDLKALAERVARGFDLQLESAGLKLRLELSEVRNVLVDRVGIEQVLANLLANAIFASPRGESVVLRLESDGELIEFSVSDEGPGVPLELRARIFEPFFTTKSPGVGTGLGLAVAFAIVRNHGGRLWLDDTSRPKGSLFRCQLPMRQPDIHMLEAPSRPALKPRSLLVIDDDAAIRDVLKRHAERRMWRCSDVESAEKAIQILRDSPQDFDVVLCDLRMSGIGGIGLHDNLKRSASPHLARFVFVTGDLASPEVAAFATRCRQPLVGKPFDFEKLFELMDGVVEAFRRSSA